MSNKNVSKLLGNTIEIYLLNIINWESFLGEKFFI
jgi:hypothetical protein